MLQSFKEKNQNNFSNSLLNKLTMKDLFKENYLNSLNNNNSNTNNNFEANKSFNKINLGMGMNFINLPQNNPKTFYPTTENPNLNRIYSNNNILLHTPDMLLPNNLNQNNFPVQQYSFNRPLIKTNIVNSNNFNIQNNNINPPEIPNTNILLPITNINTENLPKNLNNQTQNIKDKNLIPLATNNNINNNNNANYMNKINKKNSFKTINPKVNTNFTKKHKLFNTTITYNIPNSNNSGLNSNQLLLNQGNNLFSEEMLSKKRKRFIKNNKLVFVQADSAAAKRLELEGFEIKDDDLNKLENDNLENLEFHINNNAMSNNYEYNSIEDQLAKGRKPRGSRYRGVSRNGNQWQVLIMVNKKKRYVGSYSNEEEAARAYDKVALQNHGNKAKTNFDYNEDEVKKILMEPPLLKLN